MEHATDLDAKQSAKCEMMYIKQVDILYEREREMTAKNEGKR